MEASVKFARPLTEKIWILMKTSQISQKQKKSMDLESGQVSISLEIGSNNHKPLESVIIEKMCGPVGRV